MGIKSLYSQLLLSSIFMLLAGCGRSQPPSAIRQAGDGACINHQFFIPHVFDHLLTQDKTALYRGFVDSYRDGAAVDVFALSAQYFTSANGDLNMHIYEYYAHPCRDCRGTVLYSEKANMWYVVDQDDYAFRIPGEDIRDDVQLRSFFDSAGVKNPSVYGLSYLLEDVYEFDLTDTILRKHAERYVEQQIAAANEFPGRTRLRGKTVRREEVVTEAQARCARLLELFDSLSAKGYRLYWDLNFKDGSFAVLVYINPEHPLDFGIEYF